MNKMYANTTRTMLGKVTLAGVPLDLTGYALTLRAVARDVDPITKTLGGGIELLPQSGATIGHYRVTFLPADTVAIVRNTEFKVEVEAVSPSAFRSVLTEGVVLQVAPRL